MKEIPPPNKEWLNAEPPPWRRFRYQEAKGDGLSPSEERGKGYRATDVEVRLLRAALMLRRPILITGKPGIGKTSLAHYAAFHLGLGEALEWPITSRSTLKQGIYEYDAIGRLQSANDSPSDGDKPDIGRFVTLGPLGTALATSEPGRPRVLLIDEIDKADLDLPNDLLHVFEEGSHRIPELFRIKDRQPEVKVFTADSDQEFPLEGGELRCREFPLTIMTSNNEREFPPAFLRRCLRLPMSEPSPDALREIVTSRLGAAAGANAKVNELIDHFVEKRGHATLATDQLLNHAHLLLKGADMSSDALEELRKVTLQSLEGGPTAGE